MHVVIIGNGIAGITAARHIRKLSDCRITVISKETDYFFSRTALMYIYMGHQRYDHTKPYEDWFWGKNRIELLRGTVENIDFEQKTLQLSTDGRYVEYQPHWLERILKIGKKTQIPFLNHAAFTYDKLILATGSMPRMGDWPGRDLDGVQGLYSYQDLEKLEKNSPHTQHAVITGGGLIGVELAEMLHARGIGVTMLVREQSYWNNVLPAEESAIVTKHICKQGIHLKLGVELKEIRGKERVESVVTSDDLKTECQLVGVTIGVQPNVAFLRQSTALKINRGILVNEYLETNLEDVYAIGDCAEHQSPPHGRKAIEQIWYTGRIMGETVARTIAGNRTVYQPGVFFNSAKFFDLEYQTYGDIPTLLPEGIHTFFWQHPAKEICLRINYRADNRAVTGFNVLGMRLRHAVCEQWIKQQMSFEYVLQHLTEANFDPEFFERYESQILGAAFP